MSRAGALLGILLLVSCTPSKTPTNNQEPRVGRDAYRILVLTDPRLRLPGMAEVVRGVEVAISGIPELLGKKVVMEQPDADGSILAGATDDPDVLGVITFGGQDAISSAQGAIEDSAMPVFELRDDLYDSSAIAGSVFQMSAPHSWQAYRLMRYFGPSDRGYRKVVVAHDGSRAGAIAFATMTEAAQVRGVQVVESSGSADQAVAGASAEQPDAVVIEGARDFIRQVVEKLAGDAHRYRGKGSIHDGTRPQLAGFSSMLSLSPPPGSVAAGDYARAAQSGDIIDAVKTFRDAFKARFGRYPVDDEVLGYEAAMSLIEAAKRAGTVEHSKVVGELEKFDRVRFGHLPISFGPTDHAGAERDVMGLWAVPDDPSKWKGTGDWRHLMRTFTSDLERTNVLEDDWGHFFDGATPGGEAPFFNTSRWGITSGTSDPMH